MLISHLCNCWVCSGTYIFMEYSWFTVLCWFHVYSKMKSVMHIHISTLFQITFLFRWLQDKSPLCCTGGLSWLFYIWQCLHVTLYKTHYPPTKQEMWVQSVGQEGPTEKEMATQQSLLGHSSWGPRRAGHDRVAEWQDGDTLVPQCHVPPVTAWMIVGL